VACAGAARYVPFLTVLLGSNIEMLNREYIKKTLKTFGIRPTKARILICEALMMIGQPVSHGDLQTNVLLSEINRVTLYRSLNVLVEAGIVHKVLGIDGRWYFCIHELDEPGCPGGHPHFYCLKCGNMKCLRGDKLPFVEVPPGCHVEGKQLLVYGICEKCFKETKEFN
jgi:Fur family ferric uptake transcriptional regulator/Fur family zinc uptake transcriptional regulator